jgi:hypothetical protein
MHEIPPPSGEVRIVRTLTPQILDWKDRICESRKERGTSVGSEDGSGEFQDQDFSLADAASPRPIPAKDRPEIAGSVSATCP